MNISPKLKTDFFFALPFAAWERGTNEIMNSIIRQFIPKQREFVTFSDRERLFITNRLKHRPRKSLDFMSPYKVFFEQSVALKF